MSESPATLSSILNGAITVDTVIPAEVLVQVNAASDGDDLFTDDSPTGRRSQKGAANVVADMRLLKAVLVLGMNYEDAYDFARYGNAKEKQKHCIVNKAMQRMRPLVRCWLDEQGLNKNWLLTEWLDMARHPEWQARKAALENLGKIQGVYAPAEIKHTVSVASKILEEIDGTSAGLPSNRD